MKIGQSDNSAYIWSVVVTAFFLKDEWCRISFYFSGYYDKPSCAAVQCASYYHSSVLFCSSYESPPLNPTPSLVSISLEAESSDFNAVVILVLSPWSVEMTLIPIRSTLFDRNAFRHIVLFKQLPLRFFFLSVARVPPECDTYTNVLFLWTDTAPSANVHGEVMHNKVMHVELQIGRPLFAVDSDRVVFNTRNMMIHARTTTDLHNPREVALRFSQCFNKPRISYPQLGGDRL